MLWDNGAMFQNELLMDDSELIENMRPRSRSFGGISPKNN